MAIIIRACILFYKIKEKQLRQFLNITSQPIFLHNQNMQNQSQPHNQTLSNQQEEQVVLFKFKRAYHEQSYDQIKIHSKKVKANPEAVQKATTNYKNRNFIDRETMLENLFQKLQLNPKQQQSAQKMRTNEVSLTKATDPNSKSYFLKKVQLPNTSQLPNSKQNEQIFTQMKTIRQHARKTDLQQKLNKLRNISSSTSINKRIKYKIIDIKKENIVDLGGQKFEYQDLSKQYMTEQGQTTNTIYDYYILQKGHHLTQTNSPSIILPQQAEYLLQDEIDHRIQAQTPQASQSDSNRQDRSDYEYPEEDYHQGDSDDQSQGIISGKNHAQGSEDQDLDNSYQEEDQEQYYREYQKRCRKQEQGDDQLTYLYNFKSKYQDDSDD